MTSLWEESSVEIHHPGQVELQQGDTEERTQNILYPTKDGAYDRAVRHYYKRKKNVIDQNTPISELLKRLYNDFGEEKVRSDINNIMSKGKPCRDNEGWDCEPVPKHNHLRQVDGAAEVFSLIGGKVDEGALKYEKIREQSVETMRENPTYQFCMLLAGFNNDKMDKYFVTPSEGLRKKRRRTDLVSTIAKKEFELEKLSVSNELPRSPKPIEADPDLMIRLKKWNKPPKRVPPKRVTGENPATPETEKTPSKIENPETPPSTPSKPLPRKDPNVEGPPLRQFEEVRERCEILKKGSRGEEFNRAKEFLKNVIASPITDSTLREYAEECLRSIPPTIRSLVGKTPEEPQTEMKKEKMAKINRAVDKIINLRKEIAQLKERSKRQSGLDFNEWYTTTSWADGRIHLSPLIYAHVEEAYNVVRRKWVHLKDVKMNAFIESKDVRSYFARLVAWCMRTSDCLSGKRFHLQSTYARVNHEKNKLLNVFRHVHVVLGELKYERKYEPYPFVGGTHTMLRDYKDDDHTLKLQYPSRPVERDIIREMLTVNKAMALSKAYNNML